MREEGRRNRSRALPVDEDVDLHSVTKEAIGKANQVVKSRASRGGVDESEDIIEGEGAEDEIARPNSLSRPYGKERFQRLPETKSRGRSFVVERSSEEELEVPAENRLIVSETTSEYYSREIQQNFVESLVQRDLEIAADTPKEPTVRRVCILGESHSDFLSKPEPTKSLTFSLASTAEELGAFLRQAKVEEARALFRSAPQKRIELPSSPDALKLKGVLKKSSSSRSGPGL